jgi:preprotein translocase subunit SecE
VRSTGSTSRRCRFASRWWSRRGAGAGFAWFSWYGREFWQFAQAARVELRKVVWPTRDETVKTTYVVFIFAIVMGLFFWGLDWILTWLTGC